MDEINEGQTPNSIFQANGNNFCFKPTTMNTPNVPPLLSKISHNRRLMRFETANTGEISNSDWSSQSSFNDTLSLPSNFKISSRKSFSKVII